jgi:anaerobic dimethyl sulfoxide reductase subunit B (iron-sulfur subunit)
MNPQRYIIDLARCTGCQACAIACKDRANLPDDLDWLQVLVYEGGTYPAPTLTYRVNHCFHCAAPTCMAACPELAITRQENTFIQIKAALCTGCGQCIDACPFSAIVMEPAGIASKCDGCADEVARGWEPTCVRACLMRALRFGVETSPLPDKRIRDQAFEDHGIGPAVLYLRWSGD